MHLLEILLTRSLVLLPLVLLGFAPEAINAYVVLVGLQAVLAHEAAHITGGHITRRMDNMRAARNAAGLGLVLAAAAGAATGRADAAAGLAIGAQSSAMRSFLGHSRAEESSADIASIRTLVQAGIDPRGALQVQEIFLGQEALNVGRQDPYMLSHPLTRDRERAAKAFIAGNPADAGDDRVETPDGAVTVSRVGLWVDDPRAVAAQLTAGLTPAS